MVTQQHGACSRSGSALSVLALGGSCSLPQPAATSSSGVVVETAFCCRVRCRSSSPAPPHPHHPQERPLAKNNLLVLPASGLEFSAVCGCCVLMFVAAGARVRHWRVIERACGRKCKQGESVVEAGGGAARRAGCSVLPVLSEALSRIPANLPKRPASKLASSQSAWARGPRSHSHTHAAGVSMSTTYAHVSGSDRRRATSAGPHEKRSSVLRPARTSGHQSPPVSSITLCGPTGSPETSLVRTHPQSGPPKFHVCPVVSCSGSRERLFLPRRRDDGLFSIFVWVARRNGQISNRYSPWGRVKHCDANTK